MTTTTHPSAVERLAAALFASDPDGYTDVRRQALDILAAAAKACRDALEGAK